MSLIKNRKVIDYLLNKEEYIQKIFGSDYVVLYEEDISNDDTSNIIREFFNEEYEVIGPNGYYASKFYLIRKDVFEKRIKEELVKGGN